MKRNPDVSRAPLILSREAVHDCTQHTSCAAEIESAAVLLVRTMQETDPPIAQLSGALARMVDAVSQMRAQANHLPHSSEATASQAAVEALARDIAVCIENLQFHDRLAQQLTQVKERLARLATNKILESVPATPVPPGSVELF